MRLLPVLLLLPLARTSATSCCAGTFVAQGRGGLYPPGPRGRAFDFVASNDNVTMRFAQRAADPAVEMGNVNLPAVNGRGGGHWFWTNATNCRKLPNSQTTPNLCFGEGHNFKTDRGVVTLAGGLQVQRWSDSPISVHIICAPPPSVIRCYEPARRRRRACVCVPVRADVPETDRCVLCWSCLPTCLPTCIPACIPACSTATGRHYAATALPDGHGARIWSVSDRTGCDRGHGGRLGGVLQRPERQTAGRGCVSDSELLPARAANVAH